MQIKHSLKRHIIGAGMLGAVALLALTSGSGDAPGGGATPAADGAQAATATIERLAAMTARTSAAAQASTMAAAPAPTPAQAPVAAPAPGPVAAPAPVASAAPAPTPAATQAPAIAAAAQTLQRTLFQTERRVADLRQQGGDANAVYRLRASTLPAAVVASLMERETAEAGLRQASHGAAARPPALKQD